MGSTEEQHQQQVGMSHLDSQMQMHMRLFRAQRNFYISGFALFLFLVIKKLVALISANAGLEAAKEAAMKQAESASRAAESLMTAPVEESTGTTDVENLKEAVEKAKMDVNSMKSQSESLAKEYDRLMEEKDCLERKVNSMGGGDKKDD